MNFKISGEDTGGTIAIVEHPMPPKALGAPLHRHTCEDELSYVLEGEVGVQLGDDVFVAGAGSYVFKPRDEWHTFWNPGDVPARLLEIISPAGFEKYFEAIGEVFAADVPDMSRLMEIASRHGLDVDQASIPTLVERHGLRL